MPRYELIAVLCAIAGASLWGVVWYPLNVLEELGVKGLWTIFLVFLFLSLVALPFLARACRRGQCPFVAWPTLLLVVFGGLTNLLFFLALTETSVVRALMFFYLSPIWNLLLARFVRGQRLSWQKFLVIVISLAGAAILLGLYRFQTFYWNLGDTFALLSGLSFAVSVIGLQLNPRTPSWALTVVHWFGTAFTALIGILVWAPPPPPWEASSQWLPLLVLFAFGMQATASLFILFSLTRLESYRVNILMLFEIVVATVSYALWSLNVIALHEWLGIGFILLASLLDNLRFRKQIPASV
ncbi:MAG: DMT family transporter [Deltaproteobacteria bacterium]